MIMHRPRRRQVDVRPAGWSAVLVQHQGDDRPGRSGRATSRGGHRLGPPRAPAAAATAWPPRAPWTATGPATAHRARPTSAPPSGTPPTGRSRPTPVSVSISTASSDRSPLASACTATTRRRGSGAVEQLGDLQRAGRSSARRPRTAYAEPAAVADHDHSRPGRIRRDHRRHADRRRRPRAISGRPTYRARARRRSSAKIAVRRSVTGNRQARSAEEVGSLTGEGVPQPAEDAAAGLLHA